MEHSQTYKAFAASTIGLADRFIEKGYFDSSLPEELWTKDAEKGAVAETQVRRACRALAKEMKRPFIIASPRYLSSVWDSTYQRWTPVARHMVYGWVEVPKAQKYFPLISMLELGAVDGGRAAGSIWSYRRVPENEKEKVASSHLTRLWRFRVPVWLWPHYIQKLDTDPDLRRLRGLTPEVTG